MELLLLQAAAFLRPIFFIDFRGSNLFDIAAIGIFVALTVALFANVALRKEIRLGSVDLMIGLFGIWCISIFLIYFEDAKVRALAQLLIPLFTYTVAKNVLKSRSEYFNLLNLMILGFVIPVTFSIIIILMGEGVAWVNYWTKVTRWQGAYNGSHSFGHNMTFLLILATIYSALLREHVADIPEKLGLTKKLLFGSLIVLAMTGLILSQVRTAMMGLIVMLVLYGWFLNRKLLFKISAIVAVLIVVLGPIIFPIIFFDIYRVLEGGESVSKIGSGRFGFWAAAVQLFIELPIDQQIAGIGIGNRSVSFGGYGVRDPHNDWLYVLMQAGIVGAMLFALIQIFMLRAILRMEGKERYVFLSFFVAIQLMNLVSNSYISRFGLAQMYYMVMAYIELRAVPASNRVKPGGSSRRPNE